MWSSAWEWLRNTAAFLYNDLLNTLMANVPESWKCTVDESVRPIIQFTEMWFPLSFAVTLLMAWVSFLIAFILLKMILKLCPFIG